MQTKLTLRLDSEVIERAKVYAKKNNASLSKMIQIYLENLVSSSNQTDDKISPLVKSLSGVISLDYADDKKEYIEYLTKKYK